MEQAYYFPLLFGVGFLAGVINTLAGGGSLLTLPTLIFLGLPSHIANGTNRVVIVGQSFASILTYRSKGYSGFPFAGYLGISASIGALVGASIAIDLSGVVFNRILAIILMVVGVLTVLKPKALTPNQEERVRGKHLVWSLLGFFCIGIYGGFINAGIGIVIMLFLNKVNRLDLLKSNVIKVSLVCLYSVGALALFAYHGAVDWLLGSVMMMGSVVGAWWASRWSIKKGAPLIRWALLIMVFVMAIKLVFFQ